MGPQKLAFTNKKLHFKKEHVIFNEGEEGGNEMYFIDSGRVKIVTKIGDTEATLAILDSGDFFGELSLITGNKRVATAITLTDCKFHTMDKETLNSNLSNNEEFMKKTLKSLAHRIEETDLTLKHHLQRISRLTKVINTNG